MRTTLTIDDDVAIRLREIQASRHQRFKKIANDAMRLGLREMTRPSPSTLLARTTSVSLGRCLIGNIDDVSEALAVGEGEAFR
jgi:hypothetical protein